VHERLETLAHLEDKLTNRLEAFSVPNEVQQQLREQGLFSFGEQIPGLLSQLQGREHWDMVVKQFFLPGLTRGIRMVRDHCGRNHQLECDRATTGIATEFSAVINAIAAYFAWRDSIRLRKYHDTIDAHTPEEQHALTLSQKALNVVASISGVTVVLCGMRRPEYVGDALGVLKTGVFEESREILGKESS